MAWIDIINGILLIAALTTDSFVVSFAYGAQNRKMPLEIVLVMNLVMSSLLGLALWAGELLGEIFPLKLTSGLGIILLFAIGGSRILKFFQQKPEEWEEQQCGRLTMAQGILMAFVLSLDSLAVGIGTGLAEGGAGFLVPGNLAGGVLMMLAGWQAGNRICRAFRRDLSWVSGLCLVFLALCSLCKL